MVETCIGPPQPWKAPGANAFQHQGVFQRPDRAYQEWVAPQRQLGRRPRANERQHLTHSRIKAFDHIGEAALHGAKYPEDNRPDIGARGSPRKQQKHFPGGDHLKPGELFDSQKWADKPIPKNDDFLYDHFMGMVVNTGSREAIEGRGLKRILAEGKSNGAMAIEGVPLPARAPRESRPIEDSRQVQGALLGVPLPENPDGRRGVLQAEDSTQVVQALLAIPETPDERPRRGFWPEEDSRQVVASLHGVPLPEEYTRDALPQEDSKRVGAVVSGWECTADKHQLHFHNHGYRLPADMEMPGYVNSKQVVDSLLGVPIPQEPRRNAAGELEPYYAFDGIRMIQKEPLADAASHQVNAVLRGGVYVYNSPRFIPRKPLDHEDSKQVADLLRREYQTSMLEPQNLWQRHETREGSKVSGTLTRSRSEPTIGSQSSRQNGARNSAFADPRPGSMAPCAPHAQGVVRTMSDSLQAAATNALSFGGRGHKFGYGGFLWNHPSRLRSSEFAMLQNSHTDPGQVTYNRRDPRNLYTT